MAATIVFSILFAAGLFFGVRSWRRRLTSGCCGAGGDAVRKTRVADRDPRHYPYAETVAIGGMTCKNCEARVENALNELDGVYATVRLRSRSAAVRMKRRLPDSMLREALERAGYTMGGILEELPRPSARA